MKDIIRTCNPTIKFSNFRLNIKIYDKFEEFLFKLVRKETLFMVGALVACVVSLSVVQTSEIA